jgi:ATP-dependent Lhr-like helicase
VFHFAVTRWFAEAIGTPTAAQTRGWESIRAKRHTLIAAPTGSGKTLAAFLTALDDLFREGIGREGVVAGLPDEVRVVYVSPLKALSADIHKNLAEPRRGIRRAAEALGVDAPRITAAVRTGDTPASERAAMLRRPPHILVTTPESLYLMLTAERSREMLRTARTVIVDEIHAVIGTRRGAHLSLSLERLQEVAGTPLLRLGLSATQKPIDEVARFLVGAGTPLEGCTIVDEGHRRAMDLSLELPRSPLDAVMSHEVWTEYYERLAELIGQHRTTLVFVNTRRMAERVAHHLAEPLGEEAVTAHHGSLSKERRLDAETRLKSGTLKALVATASLELGIDIGSVDLVCQIGSPHRIATFLQRVGRSGHTISGLPKGRLFPESREDLVECTALLGAVNRGELDRIVQHDAPLDVLAQQVVAETSCRPYPEDELFGLVRRAWPYRELPRRDFDAVVAMTAEGFATRRGRRGALVHRDEVNAMIRGRRHSRLLALTSGGAIPEVADYRVVLDPGDTFIGTLNEDFAIESLAGDIFQLGNASWQILQVLPGVVRVADAKGAPPTIPFWLGEAPARSDELSRSVSELYAGVEAHAATGGDGTAAWLASERGVSTAAAQQVAAYLMDGRRTLGRLPTQDTLILERFFDEAGGMQLVLHAPFGSRINKAWGLALRKRFCRQFNFELQASATEDAILLSLGPQHSFPLSDVFRYLHHATARDVLVQAFLDAPVFQTRWRWNATISLAVPRNRNGRKVAPQIQRMQADDLMAACFPDAAACLENIPGDRQIPEHPLVSQTVRDCLEEAMDFDGLAAVLRRIHSGQIRCVSVDTPEPSVLAHAILNAKPYAFLDDAPLEERRTRAVLTRRSGDGAEVGRLDRAAIARVRDEEAPSARDADELHDALLTAGFLTAQETASIAPALFEQLALTRRAAAVQLPSASGLWIAAERLPELLAIHPTLKTQPAIEAPPSRRERVWTLEDALAELLRGRMTILGPATAEDLATSLAVLGGDVDAALLALEGDGSVLRGSFEGRQTLEWCDRRLLARIHRYTLNRLRAEIEPVSPADFMRFLFAWQHVDSAHQLCHVEGLREVVDQLSGFPAPAGAWERSILPGRVTGYDASILDTLCLAGEVAWARGGMAPLLPAQLIAAAPIMLFRREHAAFWAGCRDAEDSGAAPALDAETRAVLDALRDRGALFAHEIVVRCGFGTEGLTTAYRALAQLVTAGLVTSDGFGGLRGLLRRTAGSERGRGTGPSRGRRAPTSSAALPTPGSASASSSVVTRVSARDAVAGRWSVLAADWGTGDREPGRHSVPERTEFLASALLRRYGVVFRRLLTREPAMPIWRDLVRVYRTLEARGEIRGGRFVAGMSGDQFALPEAVERLREVRRMAPDGRLLTVSAADPLNLAGIVTSGDRIRVQTSSRILYRDGVPLAAMEGDYVRPLSEVPPAVMPLVATTLAGRPVPSILSGFVGRTD